MVKKYLLFEAGEVRRLFKSYFKTDFPTFYDGLRSIQFKQIAINIFEFDKWLHEQHGDYESQDFSMSSIIREKYGNEAEELIHSLL